MNIASIQLIIVTYQPKQDVLAKLLTQLGDMPFIIVDNTEEAFLELDSKLQKNQRIVRNNKNVGYGGGVNIGIQYALEQKAKWVVIINQDLHITKKALDNLRDALSHNASGIFGPFTGKFDEKCWTTILPSKKVDYISGACMAIHKTVFEQIGYFYEPYFMYYEDADFCVRAKREGFPLISLDGVGISHTDGSSLGRGSFLHHYYLARNHLLFVERNAQMSVKIHETVRLPKTIWEHYKKQEWGALVGIRDYFLRRFGKYTPLW